MPEIVSTLAAPAENGATLFGVTLSCPSENGATIYSEGGTYAPPAAPPGGTTTAPSTAARFVIANSGAYAMAHVLSVLDLRDNTELPVDTLSLTDDEDSLFWSVSLSGKKELYDRLAAGDQPASVRVTLNGQVWEFVIDALTRARTFPAHAAQARGRSLTSAAGTPYELEQTWSVDGDTSAAQIAASANLVTGLEVVWGVTDWPIPDRVFSHVGTPLSVVKRLADSIGAMVKSDRFGYTVRVLPRYSVLANELASTPPDVEIAVEAVITESFERIDRPDYDGVYCMGQQQGAFAFVRLAGTSGANQAPLVTDALLTDNDACSQRGMAVLGSSGQRQRHSLTLPVLSGSGEPGVLDVGMLVRVVEPGLTWYGVVRGVAVTLAAPTARQVIQVERHTRLLAGTTIAPAPSGSPLLFSGAIADIAPATGAAVSVNLAPFWSLGVPPYVWGIRSGSLPAWLALNTATGALTGTAPGSAVSPAPVAFRVTDAINSTADSNVLQVSAVAPAVFAWTQLSLATGNYAAVASSADGTKLLAGRLGGFLYTSTDSGANWTQRDSSRNWLRCASSADGTKLLASASGSNTTTFLYKSTDSGATWTTAAFAANWTGIASSADGTKLIAARSELSTGGIWRSTDSGATWTEVLALVRSWTFLASSDDGTKLVATCSPTYGSNFIYVSNDSGATWTARATQRGWNCCASSADGTKLIAVSDFIYTSADSGVTWTQRNSSRSWIGCASSADGTRLVAGAYGGLVYLSSDSGVTWTTSASARNWYGFASSADGLKLIGASLPGFVFRGA